MFFCPTHRRGAFVIERRTRAAFGTSPWRIPSKTNEQAHSGKQPSKPTKNMHSPRIYVMLYAIPVKAG